MRKVLLGISLYGCLLAADTPYWVQPCTNPDTSCRAGDVELASWALEAWQTASNGRLHFVPAKDEESSLLRLIWATPSEGLYGETRAILVNGRRGAQIFVNLAAANSKDPLLRETIAYLTCLHESGHALGLSHTDQFDDIMYSFQFGGDIPEYFGRYRKKLMKREDIRKYSGLSPADRMHLLERLAEVTAH